MKLYQKIHKTIYKLKSRPILSLLIGLSLLSALFIATILVYSSGSDYFGNSSQEVSQVMKKSDDNSKLFGVVKKIDTDKKLIIIFDINSLKDVVLNYTEGSRIYDKFGQEMSIDQNLIGTIVDSGYNKDDNKLVKLQISKKAWEYKDAYNLNINKSGFFMKVADLKYKYTDDIMVFDNTSLVSVDNLAEQDVLTLWGYQETVWSVIVNKGHGTVKIKDYGNFLGGNIAIGYEDMQQITKDTSIVVREGNFNLSVENGDFVASKNITVKRNKETKVSLDNMGIEGIKMGKLTFDISPFGADLFIDGVLISYANPIKLAYGSHKIKVSLDGYTTYEQYINVDEAGKTMKIILPKVDSSSNTASTNNSNTSNSPNTTSPTNTPSNQNTADASSTSDISNPSNASSADNNSQTTNSSNSSDTVDSADTSSKKDTDNSSIDKNHKIYIQNPIGASVYLDGEYMGTSPGNFKKYIGSHVLTFIKNGYITKSYTVEVKNDGKDIYFSLPSLVKSTKK